MQLKFELEEYFKYHPPTTTERVSAHLKVNEMALECWSRRLKNDFS